MNPFALSDRPQDWSREQEDEHRDQGRCDKMRTVGYTAPHPDPSKLLYLHSVNAMAVVGHKAVWIFKKMIPWFEPSRSGTPTTRLNKEEPDERIKHNYSCGGHGRTVDVLACLTYPGWTTKGNKGVWRESSGQMMWQSTLKTSHWLPLLRLFARLFSAVSSVFG